MNGFIGGGVQTWKTPYVCPWVYMNEHKQTKRIWSIKPSSQCRHCNCKTIDSSYCSSTF